MAKLYVDGPGAALVRDIHGKRGAVISRLSEVEVASALYRRHADGDFSTAERDRLLAAWSLDLRHFDVIELDIAVAQAARQLLGRHRLRCGDAIQLASALVLRRELGRPLPFVCFDKRLAEAARHEGLEILAGPRT